MIALKRWLLAPLFILPAVCIAIACFTALEPYNSVQLWITRLWVLFLIAYLFNPIFLQTDSREKIKHFFLERVAPENLAIFRIAHFSLLMGVIILFGNTLGERITLGFSAFPESSKVAIPYAGYFSWLPVGPEIVAYAGWAFIITASMSFLGLWTSVSVKLYLLLAFYLFGIPQLYGKIGHSHYLIWFPAILAFSDCGRTLSLDSVIRKYLLRKPSDDTPSAKYGLPLKFAMLILGIIYFFPGFWKLWANGFDWIFQLNLRNLLYSKWDELNYLPSFRIDKYPALIIALSIITVVFEFGFIFFMLRKSFRIPLALAGIAMHLGILYFMKINFLPLCVNYVLLVDWGRLFKKTEEPLQGAGKNVYQMPSGMKVLTFTFSVMVTINILFGFGKVNSWPFACFPTFDYLIHAETEVVYYEGFKKGEITLPHDTVNKRITARIPYYVLRTLNSDLMANYFNQDTSAVASFVHRIFPFHEDYQDVDSIRLSVVRKPTSPEHKNEIISKRKIYTLKLSHEPP